MPALRRMTAAGATLLVAVVLWAPPASAHAILLRTEPAPQTTVKTAPAAVHLHFSEPVEVAFGAVRVFDVNGTRVDPGTIRRADGNREVVVPVTLKDGTYTVTWRVTSADGHAVRGGFGFFVGSPSTISAVAVPLDKGAAALVTWGYGVVRFLWFGALLGIVGLVVTRRWVWTPAVQAAGLVGSPAAEGFRWRFRRALPAAWVVLVAAGLLTLVFQAATVSGLSLGSSFKPHVLNDLLGTTFGGLWRIQIALAVALGLPVFALVVARPPRRVPPRAWVVVLCALAGALCLASAQNGHARTFSAPGLMVPSLGVHLFAVAAWVGGLAALVVLGRLSWRQVPAEARPGFLRHLVDRFSRLAVVAVIVLTVTGTVVSVGAFGAVSDLWNVTFGRVVAAKVALLAVAVALAARHRSRARRGAVRSFERTSAAELVVVAGAVALASALVALVPGHSLALAANGPVNQERRAGSYTLQLYVDPTRVGDNEFHVTFVNSAGLAAAEVANVAVTLAPTGSPPQPIEMRLISPGHFVGDSQLPAPGGYQLAVTTPAVPGATTTFDFRLRGKSSDQ